MNFLHIFLVQSSSLDTMIACLYCWSWSHFGFDGFDSWTRIFIRSTDCGGGR